MKSKLQKFYKKLTFLQGVVLAVCLSSIMSIAATNLPGFFVFSAGTPISSSEINSNFEKIAGSVVFKGSVSSAFSIINSNFTAFPDCPTCNMYRKRILFDNISVSDANYKEINENYDYFSTLGQAFSYYEVSVSGWYEIRFIGQVTLSAANAVCNAASCSHNIFGNMNVQVANSLSGTQSLYYYNNMNYGTNFSQMDNNGDSSFDNTYNGDNSIPEIKRFYLKAGQKVFVKFDASYNQTNVTADYTVGYPVNSIDLTIIKL